MAAGDLKLRGWNIGLVLVVVFAIVAWLASDWRAAPAAASASRSAPLDDATPLTGLRIDYARLDDRIGMLMQREDMVGLAVAVVEQGRPTFVKGFGTTLAGGGEPVTTDTVFRWASLSKGVASTLVARLVVAGKLDFVHSAAYYDSSLRLYDHAEDQVTLIDLMTHRVGLPKNAYDGRLEDDQPPRAIRASLGAVPPLCPPGTCHSYQNVAFDSVAEIVAHATGHSYAREVGNRIFAPLGMTSASVGRDGLVGAQRWARPHRNQRTLDVAEAYYRIPAAAGVNSDITDLARWMEAQMGETPTVLSPNLLDVIHRPRVATRRPYGGTAFGRALDDPAYGLGWRSFTFRGHRLVGHSGAVAGYRSTLLFDPQARIGVAMLWNSTSSIPFRLPGEVLDDYYGEPFFDFLGLDEASASSRPKVARSEL